MPRKKPVTPSSARQTEVQRLTIPINKKTRIIRAGAERSGSCFDWFCAFGHRICDRLEWDAQTAIFFYRDVDGGSPVVEWLMGLRRTDRKAFAKCNGLIRRLASSGYELRRPHAD